MHTYTHTCTYTYVWMYRSCTIKCSKLLHVCLQFTCLDSHHSTHPTSAYGELPDTSATSPPAVCLYTHVNMARHVYSSQFPRTFQELGLVSGQENVPLQSSSTPPRFHNTVIVHHTFPPSSLSPSLCKAVGYVSEEDYEHDEVTAKDHNIPHASTICSKTHHVYM